VTADRDGGRVGVTEGARRLAKTWHSLEGAMILPHPFFGRCRSLSRSITAAEGRSAA
jgi:hypothetical protein